MTDQNDRNTEHETYDDKFEYTRRVSPDGDYIDGDEISAIDTDGNTYAGKWSRDQMKQTDSLSFGFKIHDSLTGKSDIGIPRDAMYRHTVLSGTTGYGKTTILQNWMYQFASDGDGFLFIDGKGTEGSRLLRILPDHRLDDVTIIGDGFDGQSYGINVLETKTAPSSDQFESEVDNIVSAYIPLLRDEDYWGPEVDAFTRHFLKALIYANAEKDAGYTLADFARAVNEETYREALTEKIDDSIAEEYEVKIDAMQIDSSNLDTFGQTIDALISNENINGAVNAEDGIDIEETLDKNSIIIASVPFDSREVTATLFPRIWANRALQSEVPLDERDTFGIFFDEADSTVSESMGLASAVSKARALKTPFFFAVQKPSNISNSIRRNVFGNCSNFVLLNPGNMDEANVFSRFIDDLGSKEQVNLGRFEAILHTLVDSTPELIKSVSVYPQYPPSRSRSEGFHRVVDN